MNFVAFDFETANAKRNSACSLALTVVQNNQIVDELYSLINPKTNFDYRNIAIHGIKPQMVADSPDFSELWPHISFLRLNRSSLRIMPFRLQRTDAHVGKIRNSCPSFQRHRYRQDKQAIL